MSLKPFMFAVTAIAVAATATLPAEPALAGNYGMGGGMHYGMGSGPHCKTGGISIYKPIKIYKPVNVYKNVYVKKDINIYKPVTIKKDINIYKNINASKNININKNVNINKNIVINKGNSSAEAAAIAIAAAQSNASAAAISVSGASSYSDTTVVNQGGGGELSVSAQETCHMQEASVVKAIHVVCVAQGREFPASHMLADTWIDSSYEGEVARCIPGATIKAVIGDVLQSDQGMAGTYAHGQVLSCGPHEALRHYKDGMLKCAPAVPVPDCTERTNLRRYGTGDLFFSYRAEVCVTGSEHKVSARDLDLTGMSLQGGVGDGN